MARLPLLIVMLLVLAGDITTCASQNELRVETSSQHVERRSLGTASKVHDGAQYVS